jgi:hypothetical protein
MEKATMRIFGANSKKNEATPAAPLGNDREFFMRDYAPPQIRGEVYPLPSNHWNSAKILVLNRAGNGQGGGLRNTEAQVRQQTIGGAILRGIIIIFEAKFTCKHSDRHFIVMCAQALFLFVIMTILINLLLSRSARRT